MPSDWVCRVVENYTAAADRFRVCVEFAEGFRLQRTGQSSRREERAEQYAKRPQSFHKIGLKRCS